jgi:hypothetical protein
MKASGSPSKEKRCVEKKREVISLNYRGSPMSSISLANGSGEK